MNKVKLFFSNLIEFFLKPYEDLPLEIQKKMKNLIVLNIFGLIFWTIVIIGRLVTNNRTVFLITGDVIAMFLFPTSLYLVWKKKPLWAGNVTISFISVVIVQLVISDLYALNFRNIDRLYKTVAVFIIGILVISLFVLKKVQFLIYTGLAITITCIHFAILFHFYHESYYQNIFSVLAESLILLIIGGLTGFYILSLTIRSRSKVINNIIFYRMTKLGPAPFFTEHSIDNDMVFRSGLYLYTAIGQGQKHNTGLFGPIPFGDDDSQVALLYACFLYDSAYHDDRYKNKNYVIIAFIAKPEEVHLIDRHKFAHIISEQIKNIDDISLDKEEKLYRIINSIRNQ